MLITDVRRHWAATWIMAVARAGVMEPYANHAFQPATPVRRIDLAQVVSRLLERIAEATPDRAHPWLTARAVVLRSVAEPSRVSGGLGRRRRPAC